MNELILVANDRVGLLADISEALAKKNINIESIDAEVTGKKAVCRIMTSTEEERDAKSELKKAGFTVMSADVLVLKLVNRPGQLSEVARILADNGVNVTNVHLLTKTDDFALCALSVNKKNIAKEVLSSYIQ